jgi:hypothetical protein
VPQRSQWFLRVLSRRAQTLLPTFALQQQCKGHSLPVHIRSNSTDFKNLAINCVILFLNRACRAPASAAVRERESFVMVHSPLPCLQLCAWQEVVP